MAFIQTNEIGVKEYGNEVTVEENDVAKLMYYLNCVCLTVNCADDREISRFTDYRHWRRLSIDDQKKLLVVCYTFSPDVFEDKVFFESDALCRGAPNRLYEISQVRHQVLAVSNIIVAGRSRQVNKIMAYTMPWMHYCYIQPMKGLIERFSEQERPRQRAIEQERPRQRAIQQERPRQRAIEQEWPRQREVEHERLLPRQPQNERDQCCCVIC